MTNVSQSNKSLEESDDFISSLGRRQKSESEQTHRVNESPGRQRLLFQSNNLNVDKKFSVGEGRRSTTDLYSHPTTTEYGVHESIL
jgi:hypothetical protein